MLEAAHRGMGIPFEMPSIAPCDISSRAAKVLTIGVPQAAAGSEKSGGIEGLQRVAAEFGAG